MTDNDKQIPDQPQLGQADGNKSDFARPELEDPLNAPLESDAAIEADSESAAAASDTFEQAADDLPGTEDLSAAEEEGQPQPSTKLERLQKILAKSGIASRRHAEELITSGRVQVNGKVVTELGSKADPDRDHIRVDGKLLQGSERHRYFMLNKPKGYVTTVSDPEGRPTIMEFFSKSRERLYPVGRLDYLSEGLLLVTNDGELANKLTRAASNVEKTYLVKVSGQPTEEDLGRLREGVGIAKGKPGSGRVQTAPAQIRLFRPGKSAGKRGPSRPTENPWYEVVLIEGRNRELRKMFEEIGHHVEKIRRVGYGPLILDLEPGKTRELEWEEVENLRKAAEGKYRKPKPREPRNREFGKRTDREAFKPHWNDQRGERTQTAPARGQGERRPFRGDKRGFEQRPETGGRRRPERNEFRRESSSEPRREYRPGARPAPRFGEERPQRVSRQDDSRRPPFRGKPPGPNRFTENRPFQQEDRSKRFGSRPPRREFGTPSFEAERPERPPRLEDRRQQRPSGPRAFQPGRSSDRPARREGQPRFDRPISEDRGGFHRPQNRPPRRERQERPHLDIQPIEDRRPQDANRPPRREHPAGEDRPRFDRPRRENRSRADGQSQRETGSRPQRENRSSSRPTGKIKSGFKGGKRNAPGGKQGSVRSSSGRRPGNRPGNNRSNKRRP